MIDFLCIGAQKSGTTLLHQQLSKVKEVFLPKVKELHFFDNPTNYSLGINWYQSFFDKLDKNIIKGEITPAYLFFERVPAQIFQALGNNVKFIVLLRNPVDRAYSQYNMSRYLHLTESLTFEESLIYESYRLNDYHNYINFSYVARGFYAKQLERYFYFFPKENFKIIIYEEFVENQSLYLQEILQFLGISRQYDFKNEKIFQNQYLPMSPATRKLLNEIFKKSIEDLEALLGRDLQIWKNCCEN